MRGSGNITGDESRHADSASHLHATLDLRGPGDDQLQRRAAGSEGDEPLVAWPAFEAAERGRHGGERVESTRSGRSEGVPHVRQFGVEDVSAARQKEMRLAKLRD